MMFGMMHLFSTIRHGNDSILITDHECPLFIHGNCWSNSAHFSRSTAFGGGAPTFKSSSIPSCFTVQIMLPTASFTIFLLMPSWLKCLSQPFDLQRCCPNKIALRQLLLTSSLFTWLFPWRHHGRRRRAADACALMVCCDEHARSC